ncbi:MAG: tRNA pseudouridine(38-40) synthase TruA, partial [Desulfobulbaceae bacterium]|nr:tRNA pseudouridine(38-40) synthase TruA [Desulfobulbaceae bacterium]
TNICKIYRAGWEIEENMAIFTIKADRFLRNMVRAIVGTMIEAGKGHHDMKLRVALGTSTDRELA